MIHSRHSEKCTPEELSALKTKTLDVLRKNGIDPDKLEIRCFPCYGGDIRVYLGESIRQNRCMSTRKTGEKWTDGNVTTHAVTRGKHTKRERDHVIFNAEDYEGEYSQVPQNILSIKNYLERESS